MPQALITSSSQDRAPKHDQAVSEVIMALHVPSESNNLSLASKTGKDLSSNATTFKRKQSEVSQEAVMSKRKRRHSQDSVQRVPSPQHTSPLNKELSHVLSHTPAGNVQQPNLYDASGLQVKSGSGTSVMSSEASSSGNQHLMGKDFTSHAPESTTNLNL